MAKSIIDVKVEEVVQVYSGRPGCACGCRGNYRVNPAHVAYADKERGYPHSGDEISLKSVKRILNYLQAHATEVTVNESGNKICYALEDENRYRWVYTKA